MAWYGRVWHGTLCLRKLPLSRLKFVSDENGILYPDDILWTPEAPTIALSCLMESDELTWPS